MPIVDKHSKKLIASNIELYLNYCKRFYDRQFIKRENINKGILERFEEHLNNYFSSEKNNSGLSSVAYFADELNLPPNYFGDLIKKETGRITQDYIQNKNIDIAKNKIFESNRTISEIAYELGFQIPQHFSRLFKNRGWYTSQEFRDLN
ncbi:MAG TPA: AraC family transcriptional regulator [Arachidicoccus sp.]|nr:AraC family transcriptional regulator [Arachidicoccus sp.]